MPTFNVKDLAAGAVFAAIGLAFMAGALTLDIGTAFKMGPGYFPLVLSGLLVLLGLIVMAKSVNMPAGNDWNGSLARPRAHSRRSRDIRRNGARPRAPHRVAAGDFRRRLGQPARRTSGARSRWWLA